MTDKRFKELERCILKGSIEFYNKLAYKDKMKLIVEIMKDNRRLRKAIEDWRKYHDHHFDYEPCLGCKKLERVLEE